MDPEGTSEACREPAHSSAFMGRGCTYFFLVLGTRASFFKSAGMGNRRSSEVTRTCPSTVVRMTSIVGENSDSTWRQAPHGVSNSSSSEAIAMERKRVFPA